VANCCSWEAGKAADLGQRRVTELSLDMVFWVMANGSYEEKGTGFSCNLISWIDSAVHCLSAI
jgi:hypothetical protein